jgi:hypothetical protein
MCSVVPCGASFLRGESHKPSTHRQTTVGSRQPVIGARVVVHEGVTAAVRDAPRRCRLRSAGLLPSSSSMMALSSHAGAPTTRTAAADWQSPTAWRLCARSCRGTVVVGSQAARCPRPTRPTARVAEGSNRTRCRPRRRNPSALLLGRRGRQRALLIRCLHFPQDEGPRQRGCDYRRPLVLLLAVMFLAFVGLGVDGLRAVALGFRHPTIAHRLAAAPRVVAREYIDSTARRPRSHSGRVRRQVERRPRCTWWRRCSCLPERTRRGCTTSAALFVDGRG